MATIRPWGSLVGAFAIAALPTVAAAAQVIVRTDGRAIEGQLALQFRADTTACEGRVNQIIFSTPPPTPQRIAPNYPLNPNQQIVQSMAALGRMGVAAREAKNRQAILDRIFFGCMAERGYVLVQR